MILNSVLNCKIKMGQEFSKTDYYQEFVISPKGVQSVDCDSTFPANELSESDKDFISHIFDKKDCKTDSKPTLNQSHSSPADIRAVPFHSTNSAPDLIPPSHSPPQSRPSSSQSNYAIQPRIRQASSQPDILSAGTNRKPRILMLGLDGAGKSALFQSMRDKKSRAQTHAPLTPTVAYNVTSLQVEGRACSLWDVSGRPLTRDLWKHYLSGADCLIWVVDSGDADRMEESRALLHKMVAHRALQGVPLLVVANKQDILTAVRPSQLEELLQLDTIRESGHLVKVVPSSATSRKDTRKLLKKTKKLLQKTKSHSIDSDRDELSN